MAEKSSKPLPLVDNQSLAQADESPAEETDDATGYINNVEKSLYKTIWAEN